MRELLSGKERRQLALLDVLVEDKSMTLSQISKTSGYPTRTLSDDIRQLNTQIGPAKILSNSAGLSLVIPASSSPREIYSRILKQSRENQLLLYLFENETEALGDISDCLYVSESTLKRMMNTLNKKLNTFSISILPSPFRISGDEVAISLFYAAVLYQTNYADHYHVDEAQRLCLMDLCTRAAEWFKVKLTYPDLVKLIYWTFVRLIRIRHGHNMVLPENEDAKAVQPPLLKDGGLLTKIDSLFGVELTPEIIYEIFYLYAHDSYAHNEADLQNIIRRSADHNNLYWSIKLALEKIASGLEIPLDGTENLLLDLFNTLQIPNTPVHTIYDKSEIFIKGFKKENQMIYTIVSKVVREVFGKKLNGYEQNAMIYTFITHWPGITEKVAANIPPVVAGVFFDTDIENAMLIADLLRRYSKLEISIIIPDPVLESEYNSLCKGIDFLITNIPGLKIKCPEIICVQEYPTKSDWKNVMLAIERIHNERIAF